MFSAFLWARRVAVSGLDLSGIEPYLRSQAAYMAAPYATAHGGAHRFFNHVLPAQQLGHTFDAIDHTLDWLQAAKQFRRSRERIVQARELVRAEAEWSDADSAALRVPPGHAEYDWFDRRFVSRSDHGFVPLGEGIDMPLYVTVRDDIPRDASATVWPLYMHYGFSLAVFPTGPTQPHLRWRCLDPRNGLFHERNEFGDSWYFRGDRNPEVLVGNAKLVLTSRYRRPEWFQLRRAPDGAMNLRGFESGPIMLRELRDPETRRVKIWLGGVALQPQLFQNIGAYEVDSEVGRNNGPLYMCFSFYDADGKQVRHIIAGQSLARWMILDHLFCGRTLLANIAPEFQRLREGGQKFLPQNITLGSAAAAHMEACPIKNIVVRFNAAGQATHFFHAADAQRAVPIPISPQWCPDYARELVQADQTLAEWSSVCAMPSNISDTESKLPGHGKAASVSYQEAFVWAMEQWMQNFWAHGSQRQVSKEVFKAIRSVYPSSPELRASVKTLLRAGENAAAVYEQNVRPGLEPLILLRILKLKALNQGLPPAVKSLCVLWSGQGDVQHRLSCFHHFVRHCPPYPGLEPYRQRLQELEALLNIKPLKRPAASAERVPREVTLKEITGRRQMFSGMVSSLATGQLAADIAQQFKSVLEANIVCTPHYYFRYMPTPNDAAEEIWDALPDDLPGAEALVLFLMTRLLNRADDRLPEAIEIACQMWSTMPNVQRRMAAFHALLDQLPSDPDLLLGYPQWRGQISVWLNLKP